jgi:hypothetical protein
MKIGFFQDYIQILISFFLQVFVLQRFRFYLSNKSYDRDGIDSVNGESNWLLFRLTLTV